MTYTRQEHASDYLSLWQARRYLPAEERCVGVTSYDEMFPSSDGRPLFGSLPSGESEPSVTTLGGRPSGTSTVEKAA